jgi:hypothetical protein
VWKSSLNRLEKVADKENVNEVKLIKNSFGDLEEKLLYLHPANEKEKA